MPSIGLPVKELVWDLIPLKASPPDLTLQDSATYEQCRDRRERVPARARRFHQLLDA
jgi:hypothetical protein